MRFAILSDVHANWYGLDVVLPDARGDYDRLIRLGDIVGYGAYPHECCEFLQRHDALCMLGNHDAATLGWAIYDEWNLVAVHALDWTRDRLSSNNQL